MAMRVVSVKSLVDNAISEVVTDAVVQAIGIVDEPVTIPQTELSSEWVVRSHLKSPQPTIHVVQMGNEHFNPAILVNTDWEYSSDTEIKVTFGKPSSGFVILHKN